MEAGGRMSGVSIGSRRNRGRAGAVHGSRSRGGFRLGVGLVLGTALAVGLTACGGSTTPSTQAAATTPPKVLTTVKVAVLPSTITDTFMPVHAMEDLGTAKANGIKITFVTVNSGSTLVTGVVAGLVTFSSAPIASVGEAIGAGDAIQAIAGTQRVSGGFILESKAGSGITTVQELAGKSICVSKAGSSTYVDAEYTNVSEKLNATVVPVGASGQEPSLLSGKVAACVETAPQSYKLLKSGQAVDLVNYDTVAPDWGAWIVKKGFVTKHRKTTEDFLRAFYQAEAKMKAQPSVAIKELEQVNGETATVAKAEAKYMFSGAPTNGALTAAEVKQAYKLVNVAGTAKNLPPVSQLATSEFAGIHG